ncbi:EscU/YscU/HrcU family type III secretion system export apparatus switch protein [Serpentinicella alkaliphila]|uniref:Flagellar biosynthesis protein n=1 Tax=Serpentinicella alkaliphila TaxID=1734049 RepID=A0A4R2TKW6_9FIRM|nr:EscU/YscU/HrcU family type III secretion system export apparatus switch protein [Serpentinicella alkaliphila]QUH24898.1 EscU/YscU/HrcU family type III secretion system export apparatus switch protein [Serpentinicella alkaliphila]TCQ01825.1 flagellar biosynthesis protein [Serpentinicella alkaliphila]
MEKMKKAVALKYNLAKDNAPKITATGQGVVAENILQKAKENEVFIYEDERLVKELIQFKVGTEIPEELYELVAQILVFVEGIDKEKGSNKKSFF